MRFLQSNQLALAVSLSVLSLSTTVFAQAGFLTSTNNQCQVYLPVVKERSVQWQGQCVQGQASEQGTAKVYNTDGSLRYIFEGVWQAGKANGQATMTWSDGGQYVGEVKDSKRNGQGTYTFNGGKYVGEYKDDKRNGQGIRTYANGNTYVGQWKDDLIHGQGTYTFADGDKYVGEFKDDKRNGQGIRTYANGNTYVGQWKDDLLHGQGTYTFANGDKYVGEFKDDKRNGQGTYTFANGGKYVGEYKDDLLHGQGMRTYADGGKYVGQWKDGLFHGQGTYTFANGDKYVGEFKDDKRNGQGTYTFANGGKYVGQWQGGKQLKGTYYWHDGGKVSCNSTSDCQTKLEARAIAEKKAEAARSSSSSSVSSYRSTPQAPKYYQCKFHCQGSGLARRSGDLTDTAPNLGGSYEASEFIKKKYKAYCEAFPFHSNGAGRASVSYVSCDAKYY